MNELGQIRTAVLTALKDAGIEALEQFPEEKIKAYTGAAATVGVGAASGKSAGSSCVTVPVAAHSQPLNNVT